MARPETARAINEQGLSIRSPHFGDWTSRLEARSDIPTGARVIVATKAFAVPEVAASVGEAHPAEVISLLNGMEHMTLLRASVHGAPVAGATIAVEALRASVTVIDHKSPFLTIVVPAAAAEFATVADLNRAGLGVRVGGSEEEVLWAKLRFLAPMALLTSYWRQPIGAALDHDSELTRSLLAEVAAVATSDAAPATPEEIATALAKLPAAMRSSLQADLEAGNESELDAIGGALIRRGESHGIATPTIEHIVRELAARTATAR